MGANRALVTVTHIYPREAPYLRRLEAAGLEVVRKIGRHGGKLSEDELIESLPGVFATLASSEPYTERVFRSAPDLRIVSRWGVGFDAIDLEAATRHGVVVCTAAGANHEAVADYALALMCALQRGLFQNHRLITGGQWRTEFRPGLWRATVGIVGLGRIGQAVARRCRGFEMRILAYEPAPNLAFVREHGIELVSLDELLRQADLVTLHCPATAEARHLINRERLALMKPTAHLINTARGTLVDEAALYEALRSGRPAGAALDVFEREPLTSSPLFGLDNVILSPHLAGVDVTSEAAMANRAIDAILAVRRGEAPAGECLVNPAVLAVR
ncbi:MAG: phosphoglycerate dehydrogenase [Candidatus Rokubacteria bacterium]|nr:phosphoglycerate dehydrogenase [Candidatus Rokubacteria bacterium]